MVNSNGSYTLTRVMDSTATDVSTSTNYGQLKVNEKLSVSKITSTLTFNDNNTVTTADDTTAPANGSTKFVVVTGTAASPVYTAYTGYAAIPAITLTAPGGGLTNAYGYATSGGFAKFVYIDARNATVTTDSTSVVYIYGDDDVAMTTDSDGSYYVYNAIIDDQITTIKVASANASAFGTGTVNLVGGASALVTDIQYNSKGFATTGTAASAATGTVKVANETVGFGIGSAAAFYGYTSDVKVFYVDKDGNISPSSIGAIQTDTTDTVKYALNSASKARYIVCEEVNTSTTTLATVTPKLTRAGTTTSITLTAGNYTNVTAGTAATTFAATFAVGDVISIAPAGNFMATYNVEVTGGTATGTKGGATYTIAAGDAANSTIIWTITATPEDGSAAVTTTYTLTLCTA